KPFSSVSLCFAFKFPGKIVLPPVRVASLSSGTGGSTGFSEGGVEFVDFVESAFSSRARATRTRGRLIVFVVAATVRILWVRWSLVGRSERVNLKFALLEAQLRIPGLDQVGDDPVIECIGLQGP